jgi:hypothetical protein
MELAKLLSIFYEHLLYIDSKLENCQLISMEPNHEYYTQPKSGTYWGFIGSGIITLFVCWLALNHLKLNFLEDAKSIYQEKHKITWETVNQKSPKYAESNPLKPEDLPDKTNLFSDRNQQASQEKAGKDSKDNLLPKSRGTSTNLKVVQIKNNQNSMEQNFQKKEDISSLSNEFGNSIKSLQLDPLMKSSPLTGQGINLSQPLDSVPRPSKIISLTNKNPPRRSVDEKSNTQRKTRPRLSPAITSGPILENFSSAPRIGKIAIECRMSAHGVYVKKMLLAVEKQWHLLIQGARSYIQYDQLPRKVVYRFSLSSDGSIQNLSQLYDKKENMGSELCRQSIASRSPFGEWNEEMINSFGHSDEVTITFEYH